MDFWVEVYNEKNKIDFSIVLLYVLLFAT